MGKDKKTEDRLPELRKRAEEILGKTLDEILEVPSEDIKELIHELQVHQIELEMQNEELRQAQLELEASRDRYSERYDFAPVGYFTIDNKGMIRETNLTSASMLGVERTSLIGSPFSSFITSDTADRFYFHRKQLSETKTPQSVELKLKKKDGSQFWAQLESVPVQDADGNVNQIRISLTNTNERKQMEEALRQSEERFNLAIDSTLDGIWDWNILTNEEYYSPRWCEILGYSHDDPELPHNYDSWASRIHPDDYDSVLNNLKAHLDEGKPYNVDYRHRHKSGKYRWQNSRGQAVFDEKANPIRMVGCIRDITERKRAEKILREQKDFAETLVDTAQAIVLVLDKEGRIVRFNRFMEDLLGYKLEEVQGKDWFSTLLPGEDHHRIRELFKQAVGVIQAHGNINPILTKDGREVFIEWYDKTLKDSEGGVIGLLAIGLDITERKWAEEKINELARFPSENPNPVLRVAKDGSILYANDASRPFLKTWKSKIGQRLPDEWNQVIFDNFNSGSKKEIEFKCDDRLFSLTIAPVVDAGYVNLYGLDITERKQAEEVLLESEKRYRRIVETAQEGIYVVDTELKIGFLNKQMAQMLGYSVEEMYTRHLIDFIDDFAPVETYRLLQWDKQEIKAPHDFRFRRKDGSELWGMISSSSVYDKNGKFVGALGMVVDITERKEAERALRKAHDELKAFVDIVSHDLRNPILAIRGFSALLLKKHQEALGDKGRKYLEQIQASAGQMASLVSDLLSLSGLGQVAPVLGEVASLQIIRAVASSLDARLNENAVELVVADDLPTIYCDRDRIYQVFDNLITNAVKFSRGAEHRKVEIGYIDRGDSHQFYVKDNGVGIGPEHHSKIFELFHRLGETDHIEGTGLGLAIVDRIVRQHGGEVWVESEVGEGATFRFILPK